MQFLERQAEDRHAGHGHEHERDAECDDAPAMHKPEPLVEAGDEPLHLPDCKFKLISLPEPRCGCCAVMPAISTPSNTPPPESGGGDKPADSSGGSDGGSSGSTGGSSGSTGGSSGGTGGNDSSGGASAAGTGGTGGDTAQKQDSGPKKPSAPGKVKLTFSEGAGDAIPVAGATYRDMYQTVDNNAQLKKEGGKVTPETGDAGDYVWQSGVHDKTPKEEQFFKELPVNIILKVSLPQWTGKGSVSADDEKKWKKWADGVKAHEDRHIAAFKKVKEVTVASALDKDVDAAIKAAWAKNDAEQVAVDGTPPPPLDAPGGTTKIGPDGKETPVSDDGKSASAAGAEEHKQGGAPSGTGGDAGSGSSPTPPSGGGGSSQPHAQA